MRVPIKLRKRHLLNASKVYEAYKEEMHEWVEGGSINEERPDVLDYIAAAIAQSEYLTLKHVISSVKDVGNRVPGDHRLLGGPVDGVLTKRLCEAVAELISSIQEGSDDDVIGELHSDEEEGHNHDKK